MIFIDANYQEAAQYFALEEFLCTQKQFDDGVFMLWQTRPTGFLEVSLNIQHGIIRNCVFHGDFFSYGDLNNLEQALANQTFTYETVKQILIEQKADQLFYQITIEEILACIFE